jgi:hypothetical protein
MGGGRSLTTFSGEVAFLGTNVTRWPVLISSNGSAETVRLRALVVAFHVVQGVVLTRLLSHAVFRT